MFDDLPPRRFEQRRPGNTVDKIIVLVFKEDAAVFRAIAAAADNPRLLNGASESLHQSRQLSQLQRVQPVPVSAHHARLIVVGIGCPQAAVFPEAIVEQKLRYYIQTIPFER